MQAGDLRLLSRFSPFSQRQRSEQGETKGLPSFHYSLFSLFTKGDPLASPEVSHHLWSREATPLVKRSGQSEKRIIFDEACESDATLAKAVLLYEKSIQQLCRLQSLTKLFKGINSINQVLQVAIRDILY